MNKKRYYLGIVLRYLILILIALPNLYLFYLIFTPLTIYPVYFLLNLFFNAQLVQNTILVNGINIEIISACVAGSAYYLLLILNLTTPNLLLKQRLKMIFLSFTALLALNVLRILILVLILLLSPSLFDITHKVFWYAISILFVILIWFSQVKFYKIKQIPVYSDIRQLILFSKSD